MSDETTLADRGDDVKAMSDEELVEALETLAAQFCHETGFATMPVKLHGLEIRHRLESLRERVEELEVIAEAVCQLDADHVEDIGQRLQAGDLSPEKAGGALQYLARRLRQSDPGGGPPDCPECDRTMRPGHFYDDPVWYCDEGHPSVWHRPRRAARRLRQSDPGGGKDDPVECPRCGWSGDEGDTVWRTIMHGREEACPECDARVLIRRTADPAAPTDEAPEVRRDELVEIVRDQLPATDWFFGHSWEEYAEGIVDAIYDHLRPPPVEEGERGDAADVLGLL